MISNFQKKLFSNADWKIFLAIIILAGVQWTCQAYKITQVDLITMKDIK